MGTPEDAAGPPRRRTSGRQAAVVEGAAPKLETSTPRPRRTTRQQSVAVKLEEEPPETPKSDAREPEPAADEVGIHAWLCCTCVSLPTCQEQLLAGVQSKSERQSSGGIVVSCVKQTRLWALPQEHGNDTHASEHLQA
jgi:hypothetical protein